MQAKKVALLGFDCAITPLVRKHIAEGIAPNFKKILDNGVVCENALVPYPTITPPNWTVMATGAWPITNQITDFWRHVPGTTPETYNSHSCFNWDHCEAESFWESAEKAGKRSIIMNFPMSYNVHKKLKNSIVIGGAALTPGVFMDGDFVGKYKGIEHVFMTDQYSAFSADMVVSTDTLPGDNVKITWKEAEGWSHVDKMGDDPLEAAFTMHFPKSMYNVKSTTWYLLVREMNNNGYDTVTLSPSKDFKEAFCTIKPGEWAHAFDAIGYLADGTTKVIRVKPKLLTMDDDADNFRLYIPHAINKDGDLWCFPPEIAQKLNKGDNIATNNTGFFCLGFGWLDYDTWLESVGIHYDWLGDTAEALLTTENWDIFYSHAHPTDYIYHALMTELDPTTCSSQAMHKKAWELHQELYRHADRYLGRLLKLLGDDTVITLISDHGATPDGPNIDMLNLLHNAGLTTMTKPDLSGFDIDSMPANMHEGLLAMSTRVDPSKSKAMPQRCCFIYVNLKGRDPEGIVEPEDYEKVQREIIDALVTYVDPGTGKHPVMLALPKKEAMLLGQGGKQCGDVVYALWPEFGSQHGSILPTSEYGIGTLKPLLVFYGPKVGIKQGYNMERVCNIVDVVPTFCYLTGFPLPKDVEGSVIYQILQDPDFRAEPVRKI